MEKITILELDDLSNNNWETFWEKAHKIKCWSLVNWVEDSSCNFLILTMFELLIRTVLKEPFYIYKIYTIFILIQLFF